ncbi:Ribosomal protein S11 [Caenorhabditis elegans]|uniref:Ribosomal protein S11 n=1 Tax=Caenorhabditis elegans TaxID=6239 RepID=Q23155_CAEEL|nr:Ribosomal protein S11 [Caenorhabditis elegans]CAA99938.1 Ribosomal protein S11 [Caenorhabditis elegans]|eukprot:NP_506131.1 Mitochondrial Ribosomal Protein, Small [Caenorhabditis elegans]
MSLRRLVSDLGRMCLQTASQSMEIQQNRAIHASIRAADSIRDAHRQGTRIGTGQVETMEGTTGAGIQTAVNTSSIDARLPTAETLKQQFDGVAYHELPLVYIRASKNNTLVTVMDNKNEVITSTSCRLEGFKNARKKTTIAGQTTGVAAGQRLVRRGIRTVRVQVKGLGPGRMTCVKGLTVAGVHVVSISDHTPLCELGPRPRKIRRI